MNSTTYKQKANKQLYSVRYYEQCEWPDVNECRVLAYSEEHALRLFRETHDEEWLVSSVKER